MPAPERTTTAAIVAAASDLLETGGPAALTMQAVAERVGVRAPSLYKRVAARDGLLALVAAASLEEVATRMREAADAHDDPVAALRAIAESIRGFARTRPEAFRLVFAPGSTAGGRTDDALGAAAAPLLEVATALCGPAQALPAARTLTAWSTGFLLMELAGAFRLGGEVETAWTWGLDLITASIGASAVAER